jgi:predicted ATP-grasp superfamily ATP-dependent carboligase
MLPLNLVHAPRLENGTLLLALTGWMDGGLVSTGTIKHVMDGRPLVEMGRITPGGFFIDNFPGSMEIAAVFRPEVKYVAGRIVRLEDRVNVFHADPAAALAFFVGAEPNIDWPTFANCIFEVARRTGVRRLISIGSFGGSVPHTREPRLFGSVSHDHLLETLRRERITPSDYEGPASFSSYLLHHGPRHDLEMISIAAEIPGYLQGANPTCIAAVARRLGSLLDLPIDIEPLRLASTEWEMKVSEAVEENEELAKTIRELEEQYDNELIRESGSE